MYLLDKEIKDKLKEIKFESKKKFDENIQIQPCSVDLILDSIFWVPRKKTKSIDLRKSKLLELDSRNYWKSISLKNNESIDIKPGEFILGRTHEKFSIPPDCAGKLEGKSSMSRLGLAVQIGSDFINPGWRGHMPIQLVNHSRTTIKIIPYIPICQIMFIKLSGIPERLYGVDELQSKYKDDDGGPSHWWRDKRIKSIQNTFSKLDIAFDIQENILSTLGVNEPDTIKRFEYFVSKLPKDNISNSDVILQNFADHEEKKKYVEKVFKIGTPTLFGIISSLSMVLGFLNYPNPPKMDLVNIIVWIFNFIFLVLFIYSLFYTNKNWFTNKILNKNS